MSPSADLPDDSAEETIFSAASQEQATAVSGADRPTPDAEGDATVVMSVAAVMVEREAPVSNDTRIPVGTVLSHTYVIEALIARGGMGEVYRAKHELLGTLHAIKVIRPELARDTSNIWRFTEEAKKLSKVRSDAVVAYEGLFRDEAGRSYLVMEFADGPSLRDVLRNRKLTVSEVRLLRKRLALGLAAAHEKLIFHRDLSPDNIILVGGRVDCAKVIDFGIAKSTEAGEATIVGENFAGKLSWVAPEQLGLYGRKVDARTDVYSLGLILGAAAAGEPLTPCETMADVFATRQNVPDLSRVPEELRAELEALLQPDPADRPGSMDALIESGSSQPTIVSTPGPLTKIAPQRQNSRLLLYIGIGLAIAAILGGVEFVLTRPKTEIATGPSALTPEIKPEMSIPAPPPTPVEPEHLVKTLGPMLAAYNCASVTPSAGPTGVTLEGFVSSADDKTRLLAAAAAVANGTSIMDQLGVLPPPLCQAGLFGPDLGASSNLEFSVDRSDGNYHVRPRSVDSDKLRVTVKPPPGMRGWMTVLFIDSSGAVASILPSSDGNGSFTSGADVKIGFPDQPTEFPVEPPDGPALVLAIASDQPFYVDQNPGERLDDYLRRLSARLKNSRNVHYGYQLVHILENG